MTTNQQFAASRRAPAARLWAAVFALALFVFAASSARASIAVPLNVEQMAAISDDVVHAKVDSSEVGVYSGKIFTTFHLNVVESFKGASKSGGAMDVSIIGGTIGRLTQRAEGVPTLKNGEEVILFLDHPAKRQAKSANNPVKFDPKSPLIQSPQIIGGFQGKFLVVDATPKSAQTGDKAAAPSKRVVLRDNPGKPSKLASHPDVETFASQLREVVKTTDKAKMSTQKIAVIGEVDVVNKSDKANALRFFDPLGGIDGSAKSAKAAAPADKAAEPAASTPAPSSQSTETSASETK